MSITAESLGLEYRAEFVPQRLSRHAKETRPSLNWRITLAKGGATLTTDYTQGIAHLPGYEFGRQTIERQEQEQRAANTGKYGGQLVGRAIPAPPFTEVLQCLLLDAEVLDSPSFEHWAADLGFDTDSRSAERTYRECLEISLKLRAILGDAEMVRLREVLRDE